MQSILIGLPSDPVGSLGLTGRDPAVGHLVRDTPLLHVVGVLDTLSDLHARVRLHRLELQDL
eukprot:8505103-Heterocapsa_arctica.AAC.1